MEEETVVHEIDGGRGFSIQICLVVNVGAFHEMPKIPDERLPIRLGSLPLWLNEGKCPEVFGEAVSCSLWK